MKLMQLVGSVLLAAVPPAFAQEQEQSAQALSFAAAPSASDWGYSLFVGAVGFDAAAAERARIDDTGFSVGLDAEYLWAGKPMSLVLGGSWVGYSDNDKLYATTIGTGNANRGDIRTQSSNASALEVHAEYGLRRRFGANNAAFGVLRGGYLLNLFSERSFGNCSDCPAQDIDISGGLYAVAGLGINASETFSLALNYKHFVSGDFDYAANLEFRWAAY